MSGSERLAKQKIDEIESLYPEMPRFEGFLSAQARGQHPFEGKDFTKTPEQDDIEAEEKYDEELLQREL